MIQIKADSPVSNSNGHVTVNLTTDTNSSANITIDFAKLLPFASKVSSETFDFFVISACAYGIDRFIERRINSVDGWSRELSVKFPVANIQKWKTVKSEIESLLSFLTGDYWNVDFHKSNFAYSNQPLDPQFSVAFSQVNLFSGGLDSLIGAIDFLQLNPKKRLLLVSHHDSDMHGPKTDQNNLIPNMETEYSGQFAYIPSVRVSLDNSTLKKETTSRSRSILFIGIALLAAGAKNIPIIVPENGTVSLNYPLSPSRRSACSTRTTHPTFISLLSQLWSKIGIQPKISNPYEFSTKGEMVKQCQNKKFLQKIVKTSNSCGKRGHRAHWIRPGATHCGVCMPCVYRRASLISVKDTTDYGTEINSLPPFKTKKGQDVAACLEYLRTPVTPLAIKNELIINGVRDLTKINNYIDVVKRTREELKKWIKRDGNSDVKKKAGIV